MSGGGSVSGNSDAGAPNLAGANLAGAHLEGAQFEGGQAARRGEGIFRGRAARQGPQQEARDRGHDERVRGTGRGRGQLNVNKTGAPKGQPDTLSEQQINELESKYPYLDVEKAQAFAKLCVRSGIDLANSPRAVDIDKIGQFADKDGPFIWTDVNKLAAIQQSRSKPMHPFRAAKVYLKAAEREPLRAKLQESLPNSDLARNKTERFDPIKSVLTTLKAHNRSAEAFVHYVGENKLDLDGGDIVEIAKNFAAGETTPFERIKEAGNRIWGETKLPPEYQLLGVVANMVLTKINEEPLETVTVDGFLEYLNYKKVTRYEEASMYTAVESYIEYMKSDRRGSISSLEVNAPGYDIWNAFV